MHNKKFILGNRGKIKLNKNFKSFCSPLKLERNVAKEREKYLIYSGVSTVIVLW